MKKKLITLLLVGTMVGTMLTGCGNKEAETVETVEQTTEVSTVVDEAVEEIEKIEGTQKLDEAETVEETTEEVTEEATEQAKELTDEEKAMLESYEPEVYEIEDVEVIEAVENVGFGTIYASAGEAPILAYNTSTGTNVPMDCSGLTTDVVDNGDGTYTYKLSGTLKFETASDASYTDWGMNVYDEATGNKIDNGSNFSGTINAVDETTLMLNVSVVANEKYNAVWGIFPANVDYAKDITNVKELKAPLVEFFY